MRKSWFTLASVMLLLVWAGTVWAGAPRDFIEQQVNQILEVLADPALKGEDKKAEKEAKVEELIEGAFNFVELSKRTLGKNWRKLTPEQRKEFTLLYRDLLRGVYMDQILTYQDEKVVFGKETMLADDRAQVDSKIVTSDKEIPMQYRLVEKDGKWRTYDVVIEGISMTKNYRTQFNDILSKKSPEAMLEDLRQKVSG